MSRVQDCVPSAGNTSFFIKGRGTHFVPRAQDCALSVGVGARIRKPSDESLMQRTDAGWMLRVVSRDSRGGPMDERRCSDTPAVNAQAL